MTKDSFNAVAASDTATIHRQMGRKRPFKRRYFVLKRILDVTGSGLGLLVLFPVFGIIAILIAAQDWGPVVFRQRRLGKNGKVFYIYKFRTMVKNAEEILKSRPELMEEYRRTYKIQNDPRILKIGKFLRKSSLDELPQLLNVFKGEMSLVGPRPIVEKELEKYGDDREYYLAVRPGCAGLWQCSGRSDTTYEERIRLDREYFIRAGFRYDLKILCLTIISVVRGSGAR